MHKFFAELIAAFIPNRMTRNQWRGILRYGLIRTALLKKRLRRESDIVPKHYLAVCAIVKNEGEYFEEWIEWHISKGVEKFYIYDNDSTDNTKEVLAPYIKSGIVVYTYFPGKKKQLPAYDDCLDRHRTDARWIAFIDLDEFIFPIKDKSIPDFLKRMEDFSAVEINWLCYGSGGAKKKLPGKVMDRFKHHAHPSHFHNKQRKTIVDPRRVVAFIGCHEVARLSGQTADSHGEPITKFFRVREPQLDVIRINHYPVKSYEEFLAKKSRGSARSNKNRMEGNFKNFAENYFDHFDHNDVLEEGGGDLTNKYHKGV